LRKFGRIFGWSLRGKVVKSGGGYNCIALPAINLLACKTLSQFGVPRDIKKKIATVPPRRNGWETLLQLTALISTTANAG